MAVKDKGISMTAFGKIFVFIYAFGDRLVVHDNWANEGGIEEIE